MSTDTNEKAVVKADVQDKWMTIKDIMNEFDLTYVYVSRSIQKGWLAPSKKISLGNKGKDQFKYVVQRSVVLAWRKRCNARSRRTDGRRKYNLYLTPAERKQFDEFRKSQIPQTEFGLANPSKKS